MGKDWIDIASAVGTVSAAIVGLAGVGVALYQNHQMKATTANEAMVRARLYASRISARLSKTTDLINYHYVAGTFTPMDMKPLQIQLHQYAELRRLFKEGFFIPEEGTVAGLIPLPNKCAHSIARAFDILQGVKREVMAVQMQNLATSTTQAERTKALSGWIAALGNAAAYLAGATAECVKAADLGAPFPFEEERFADSE